MERARIIWGETYDNTAAFNALRELLAPLGFVDLSWFGDACPCLGWADDLEETGDPRVKVWVDYYDPAKREFCDDVSDDIFVDYGGFSDSYRSWADLLVIVQQVKQAQAIERGKL